MELISGKGGSWRHSEINLLCFPFLDHLYLCTPPLPLYRTVAGGVRKEWLWKCSLTRLLCALSKAQGFLISRLSCPVISPGGKRASFSWTDPCCEQVISDGGLLLYSKASEIPRCWGRMKIWGHTFITPRFIFWPLEVMGFYPLPRRMVSCRHGRLSASTVAIPEESLCESNS